jgi:LDH2 family malate/lactate/ureidoglycolate dehydrogenase
MYDKGMSFTNASPILFPTRSIDKMFGTNPIAFAAPGKDGDYFLLDMATSTVAYGKVEINHRKNLPIPNSWGADSSGRVS